MNYENSSAKKLFFKHFCVSDGDAELEMLRTVIFQFTKLPYENITKIITKFTIDDPDERLRGPARVMSGYIEDHTGGTCFSLAWCLGSILSDSGFRCYPVMADMKRNNIHCAMVVHIGEKRYMVDPGYLLGEPIELDSRAVSIDTTFGRVEFRPKGTASYDLYTVTGSERKWRYRVRTVPVAKVQFIRFWKKSFSLPMMNSLQLTKLTDDGHLYIKNHHLRLRRDNHRVNENIRLNLESRIEQEFGIPSALTARAREYLERH